MSDPLTFIIRLSHFILPTFPQTPSRFYHSEIGSNLQQTVNQFIQVVGDCAVMLTICALYIVGKALGSWEVSYLP